MRAGPSACKLRPLMRTLQLSLAALALSLGACKNASSEPAAPAAIPPPLIGNVGAQGLPQGHPSTGQGLPPGHPGSGAGLPAGHPPIDPSNAQNVQPPAPAADEHPLRWTAPPDWRSVPPASSMRRAQFAVPGAAGDGELAVFYFGQGQGGDLDENLRRWHGQFERTDAPPTRESRTVEGLRVTITSATGRFNAGGMGTPSGPRDDWALLGAIVETPQGPWFFKLTGPRETITAARPAFDAFVGSMRW